MVFINLETFLRGMETRTGAARGEDAAALETFLRGMETAYGLREYSFSPPLKPSLEGWKLIQ